MKRVCVTGATGSFGRAFVRTILMESPDTVVVALARDEVKMEALRGAWPDEPGQPGSRLRCFLGDVRDPDRLAQAFVGCDAVVHAAALKKADLTAYSPDELLKTNVLGTVNVTHAAVAAKVARVVVLSSDKAVAPALPYGVSKAMAEFSAIQANTYAHPQGTRVTCTRYGNVLASRGSVLEIWRTRLRAGQPLALTEAGATRFWMTLDQAVALVRIALREGVGGELFIPAVKASDMLRLLVALGGQDVEVIETGFRVVSEKVHEILALPHEMERAIYREDSILGGYFVIPPAYSTWSQPILGIRAAAAYRRHGLRSDIAPRYTMEELQALVGA